MRSPLPPSHASLMMPTMREISTMGFLVIATEDRPSALPPAGTEETLLHAVADAAALGEARLQAAVAVVDGEHAVEGVAAMVGGDVLHRVARALEGLDDLVAGDPQLLHLATLLLQGLHVGVLLGEGVGLRRRAVGDADVRRRVAALDHLRLELGARGRRLQLPEAGPETRCGGREGGGGSESGRQDEKGDGSGHGVVLQGNWVLTVRRFQARHSTWGSLNAQTVRADPPDRLLK